MIEVGAWEWAFALLMTGVAGWFLMDRLLTRLYWWWVCRKDPALYAHRPEVRRRLKAGRIEWVSGWKEGRRAESVATFRPLG